MSDPVLTGFSQIAQGLYLEGLAVDHDRDIVWYSDVIGGGIHGVKPDGNKVAAFNEGRMWTGGVLLNQNGFVLSSGQGGIMWNDPQSGGFGWLINEIDGLPVNGINEMVPDGLGGIWFGTTDIENVIAGQPTRTTAIYHLALDHSLTRVADGIGFANGFMFDEEAMQLHCNDTFRGTWTYAVSSDRTLSEKQFLLDKEDADGLALGADGTLWITGFRSGSFTRVTPSGERLGDVATPAGAITQLRFGGPDGRDCYFNTVPSDGGDTLKEGGEISSRNSFLYKARCSVPGLKIASTRFNLG